MTAREHAETLWLNLLDLGPRRLAALAMVAVTMMALIAGSAYYLSRPQYTVLYTGLAALVYAMSFKVLGLALFAFEVAFFLVRPAWREEHTKYG